ncbi:MAG: flagellar protein FlaG [Spirochaetaceae bacterium]|nr:flagellar protein FlaG [Spirochaetaceae bacterium]
MSVINAIGQNLAMDGHTIYSNANAITAAKVPVEENIMQASAKVAESIVQNLAKVKQDVQELQKISDAMGHEVRFNVNEELGQVVVKIVDPSTDKVIKEIPSADVQHLQIKIRETIGLLIDEKI